MGTRSKQRGPVQLARLASKVIDPATAKRGFAKADLVSAWAEIAGPRYGAVTQPERLHWPRSQSSSGAILTVRVNGPAAIFLQHETEQFLDRINAFLGYAAVAELRLVQKPIDSKPRPESPPPDLPTATKASIRNTVAGVDNDGLRDALEELGQAIARDRLARP